MGRVQNALFVPHNDEAIGTVVLRAAARKQINHETKGREPPSEAKAPTTRIAKAIVLGTLTPDRSR